MKYLSLFENYTKELDVPEHIKQEVIYISYDIVDDGYIVSWSSDGYYPTINITKSRYANKAYYSDIKDFCDRVVDYLDSQGYQGLIKFKGDGSDSRYYPIEHSLINWGPFKDTYMCVSRYYKIEVHKKEDINESFEQPSEVVYFMDSF